MKITYADLFMILLNITAAEDIYTLDDLDEFLEDNRELEITINNS